MKLNVIHRSLLVCSLCLLPALQAMAQQATTPYQAGSAPSGGATNGIPSPMYVQDNGANAREPGWQGLANVLKKLEPSVDTSIPETASGAASRLSAMISQGQAAKALQEIERRQNANDRIIAPATDVQLLFLKGRALAALDRKPQALEVYRSMTSSYPELAEPWNNMAALYLQAGLTDPAYEALKTALSINPRYGVALRNMGMVQLMLSQKAFADASRNGIPGAAAQAQAIGRIIEGN
ncbi:tetratricopeptide repeat protein [Advenella kashmirensis]